MRVDSIWIREEIREAIVPPPLAEDGLDPMMIRGAREVKIYVVDLRSIGALLYRNGTPQGRCTAS